MGVMLVYDITNAHTFYSASFNSPTQIPEHSASGSTSLLHIFLSILRRAITCLSAAGTLHCIAAHRAVFCICHLTKLVFNLGYICLPSSSVFGWNMHSDIRRWMQNVEEFADPSIVRVLVANKLDLQAHRVSIEELRSGQPATTNYSAQ